MEEGESERARKASRRWSVWSIWLSGGWSLGDWEGQGRLAMEVGLQRRVSIAGGGYQRETESGEVPRGRVRGWDIGLGGEIGWRDGR
jgi:hypothetical protein